MSVELSKLSIDEINNKLIENYKTQVEILKSMIEDRDKLISMYGNATIDVSPTFHFISLENSLLQVIPIISIETRNA